jgi:hypothetical protein
MYKMHEKTHIKILMEYYQYNQIKKDKANKARSMYGGEEKFT